MIDLSHENIQPVVFYVIKHLRSRGIRVNLPKKISKQGLIKQAFIIVWNTVVYTNLPFVLARSKLYRYVTAPC